MEKNKVGPGNQKCEGEKEITPGNQSSEKVFGQNLKSMGRRAMEIPGDIWWKSVPGRKNSRCKGSEA